MLNTHVIQYIGVLNSLSGRSSMRKEALHIAGADTNESYSVTLKWSDILESAFDYYYTEYLPAWTLSVTAHNNPGDKIFISKKTISG